MQLGLGEEAVGLTEYQQFTSIGRLIGIDENLLQVATQPVWEGGNFRDMDWVEEALGQGFPHPASLNKTDSCSAVLLPLSLFPSGLPKSD